MMTWFQICFVDLVSESMIKKSEIVMQMIILMFTMMNSQMIIWILRICCIILEHLMFLLLILSQNNIYAFQCQEIRSQKINIVLYVYLKEGRKVSGRISFCMSNELFLCTKVYKDPWKCVHFMKGMKKIKTLDIMNCDFLCKDQSLTCFEKVHTHYIPNNLFKKGKVVHGYNLSKIDGQLKLYVEKKSSYRY